MSGFRKAGALFSLVFPERVIHAGHVPLIVPFSRNSKEGELY